MGFLDTTQYPMCDPCSLTALSFREANLGKPGARSWAIGTLNVRRKMERRWIDFESVRMYESITLAFSG